MNTTILTIIGIAATVVLGLCGIYLMIKRRYPGQITFIQESCLGLFDSIIKNMPELAVHYKGSPVGEGLVLLKGSFLNTGSKDITEDMIEERISISLPEKFRWLTAKVVSASPKVQSQVAILDRSILFETGLFRCREYVRFEALAEVPTEDTQDKKVQSNIEKKLIKSLTLHHRIADTQKIKKKELPPPDYRMRRFRRLVGPCITIVAGIALIIFLWFTGLPRELHFLIPSVDGQTIEVKVSARAGSMLRVKGIQDKTYQKSIPAEQFFKTPDIVPKIVLDPLVKFIWIPTIILYIGLPLILVLIAYREHRQNRKLRRLLSIPE